MIRCISHAPNERPDKVVGTITMQPNHSMSWKALGYFLMFMMTISFSIALAFTAMGYWVVLPFTAGIISRYASHNPFFAGGI